MTEPKPVYNVTPPHWSTSEAGRATFTRAVHNLGLDEREALKALWVTRLEDFDGTPEDAVEALFAHASERHEKLYAELRPSYHDHAEAGVVAITDVYLPDGTQIRVTARQGATSDDIALTVLALKNALGKLGKFGIHTTEPSCY